MNNSLRNKILAFAVVLTLLVSTPAFADTPDTQTQAQAQAPAQTQIQTNQNNITYPTKKPLRKRDLALKFILAMAGVAASSVIIYVGLSMYNKVMYGTTTRRVQNNTEDNDFKTPTNMKEALDIFLKKTK